MSTQGQSRRLLTTREMMDEFDVSRKTVDRWATRGLLNPIRLGPRLIGYDRADGPRRCSRDRAGRPIRLRAALWHGVEAVREPRSGLC